MQKLINSLFLSSYYDQGGAAVSAQRTFKALSAFGKPKINASFLSRFSRTPVEQVSQLHRIRQLPFFANKLVHPRFALDKLFFLRHEASKAKRFAFTSADFGFSVHKNLLVKRADIIHLHWINDGFISLKGLNQLINLGKPVVWTLHDMWAFTGGCHYAGACNHFLTSCHHCPLLRNSSDHDLSSQQYNRKKSIYQQAPLTIVACSNWLAGLAKKSALFGRFPIHVIPQPINTEQFCPYDILKLRKKYGLLSDRKILLFAAANIHDSRKGLNYFIESLKLLKANKHIPPFLCLLIGKNSQPALFENSGHEIRYHGLVSSAGEMADLYALSDLFVMPSVEDNLPNTILESMACGTPVVAFNTGGIPDMIEHKVNGYMATLRSSESLAEGIKWVLMHESPSLLEEKARDKVISTFSEQVVTNKYLALYNSIIPFSAP